MTRRLLLAGWVLLGLACDDNPPIPTGNLARPSGLAFIARPNLDSAACPGGVSDCLFRSDLLIADSEAQGVRIIQYAQEVNSDGGIAFLPEFFVPAPVSFFKLSAESPGFPTSVEALPAVGARVAHALVLAPTSGQLHVLEVRNTAYQESATSDTNIRVGGIELFEAPVGAGGVPVAMAVVDPNAEGPVPVAVLVDGLGESAAQLILLQVDLQDPDPRSMTSASRRTDVVELPAGAQDVIFREEEGQGYLLVTSIEGTAIREVPVALDGSGFAGAVRTIEAFGPTHKFVDFGVTGVLALRLDRSAAVWLRYDRLGPGFVRPEVELFSADDEIEPARRVLEPGVLTLREPLVVAGASAQLTRLGVPNISDSFIFQPDGTNTEAESPRRDVALMVHSDGFASYVLGSTVQDLTTGTATQTITRSLPPSVAVAGNTELDRVFSTFMRNDGNDLEDPGFAVEGCETPNSCNSTEITESSCADDGLVNRPYAGAVFVRASPYGTLLQGQFPSFSVTSVAPGAPLSAVIIDSRFADFDRHLLRVGDGVRVEVELESCGPNGEEIEALLTGAVRAVGIGLDTSGFASFPAAQLEIGLEVARFEPNAVFSSTTAFRASSACQQQLQALETVLSYEVHVPDSVDEAVLAEIGGEDVARVFERVPIEYRVVTSTITNLPETISVMTFGTGTSSTVSTPARLVVQGGDRASLQCRRYPAASEGMDTPNVEALGFCTSALDCGVGRICSGFLSGGCSGVCGTECLVGDCFDARIARECPRVDALITGPRVLVDLRVAGLSANASAADVIGGSGTVPADAVFHPQRGSFFVSFPGSRTLVEVPATTVAGVLNRIR